MSRFPRIVVLILLLSGCAVGPDYIKPELITSPTWDAAPDIKLESSSQETEVNLKNWWNSFEDETLSKLVKESIEGNLDLKQAAARIDAARAQVTISTSRFFPQLSLDVNSSRTA